MKKIIIIFIGVLVFLFISVCLMVSFNKDYINELLDNHYNGKEKNGKKIYTIYTFLVWYERFFIKES